MANGTPSMTIMTVGIYTLVFGAVYLALTTVFNLPIEEMNNLISQNMVSAQTAYFYDLSLDMWRAAPFFFLVGTVLHVFERSKGTEISASTYFGYMTLMIVTIVLSVFLVFAFGLSIDNITNALDQVGLLYVNQNWDTTSVRTLCTTLLYFACILPALLGSFLFMLHPIILQRVETIIDDEYSGGGGGGEYREMNLEQF